MQDIIDSYTATLKKYAVFDGVAGRREFWTFFLVNFAAYLICSVFIFVFAHSVLALLIDLLFFALILGTLVPYYAVMARRLHDSGRSGWWILISFVPFVGGLILLVLLALQTAEGPNKYNPMSVAAAAF
ncbi:MAG: DUF805 domain-containing protein [Caulobacteraceae bacterium]